MGLIEIFTDHIRNRKSLEEYVEIRKSIHERGEFNDASLIQAEKNLQRLKSEDPEIYELMYDVLEEVYRQDLGCYVEYPIMFTKNVLRLYDGIHTPRQVYEEYRNILDHPFCKV